MSSRKRTHSGSAIITVTDSHSDEQLCLHVHIGHPSKKREQMWQEILRDLRMTFSRLWGESQQREEQSFEDWLQDVDYELSRGVGGATSELDAPYYDWYERGVVASDAAESAVERAMEEQSCNGQVEEEEWIKRTEEYEEVADALREISEMQELSIDLSNPE